jgi:hypothetical protein
MSILDRNPLYNNTSHVIEAANTDTVEIAIFIALFVALAFLAWIDDRTK